MLIFGLLLGATACTHEPKYTAPTNNGGNGNNNGGGTADTGICFERDILPIFIANCAKSGCHDAVSSQEGYTLTDYASITSKGIIAGNAGGSEIYEALIEDNESKRMPQAPNPRLTTEQINLIGQWINEGAKNGTGCAPKDCNDSIFSYTGAIVPIINTYCSGCHNATTASGGIILTSYAGVKVVADNGKLTGATKRLSGYSPMPKGGNALSTCQLSQIEKWIAAGAPNN